MSFLDLAYVELGIDPIAGLQIIDAQDFAEIAGAGQHPLMITQVYSQMVASDLKIALMDVLPDEYEIYFLRNLGLPDEARIKKACSRADQAVVVTYGGRASDLWWQQNANALSRYRNLSVIQITPEDSAQLVALANRTMKLSWTIQEGMVYLSEAAVTPRVLLSASA